MKDIRDFTYEELRGEMTAISEPEFRARQIFDWVYKKGASGFDSFSNLPGGLRAKLKKNYTLSPLELFGRFQSKDRTEKFLFRLSDGFFVETVLIPAPSGRETVCLSTQVGCKFGCLFCASGLNGFKRNLSAGEILGQVLHLKHVQGREVTNFVLMGMGEPLDNAENVLKAILTLNSPHGIGAAARRITISTAGLVPGIKKLKDFPLQINLSLSLHAVTDMLRNRLMPINRKYSLEEVLAACEVYLKGGGRKITLEHILLAGLNHSPADAAGLAKIAKRLKAKINLIPYSPVQGLEFKAPAPAEMMHFKDGLEERGVSVTIRRSKGSDILAACGQLAGRTD